MTRTLGFIVRVVVYSVVIGVFGLVVWFGLVPLLWLIGTESLPNLFQALKPGTKELLLVMAGLIISHPMISYSVLLLVIAWSAYAIAQDDKWWREEHPVRRKKKKS